MLPLPFTKNVVGFECKSSVRGFKLLTSTHWLTEKQLSILSHRATGFFKYYTFPNSRKTKFLRTSSIVMFTIILLFSLKNNSLFAETNLADAYTF